MNFTLFQETNMKFMKHRPTKHYKDTTMTHRHQ